MQELARIIAGDIPDQPSFVALMESVAPTDLVAGGQAGSAGARWVSSFLFWHATSREIRRHIVRG
jgi:hypothetical protein